MGSTDRGSEIATRQVDGRTVHLREKGGVAEVIVPLRRVERRCLEIVGGLEPDPPEDRMLLSWLVPAVRAGLRDLASAASRVELAPDRLCLWVRGPGGCPSGVLVDAAALASILDGLPASSRTRLLDAIRVERSERWLRAFVVALTGADPLPLRGALGARLVAAEHAHDRGLALALAAEPRLPQGWVPRVLALLDGPEHARAAALALAAGTLQGEALEAATDALLDAPVPEAEPLFVAALRDGPRGQQLRAVRALGEVGTPASLPALREAGNRWLQRVPGTARAVARIVGRSHLGAVSVSAGEGGEVSVAPDTAD